MFFDLEDKTERTALSDYNWLSPDGKEFFMNETEWSEVIERFDRKDIIRHIGGIVKEHQIPFPYKNHSAIRTHKEFNLLKSYSSFAYKGAWSHRSLPVTMPLTYQDEGVLLVGDALGKIVSDQYTMGERLKARTRGISVVDRWEGLLKGRFEPETLNFFIGLMYEKNLSANTLRSSMRMHGIIASQFSPSLARSVYEFFRAKDVLDFSSGWGDRLVGFHASNARSYTGIDPNHRLLEPYRDISDFCNTGKTVKHICDSASNVDFSSLSYDFVFTSPPYFDLEIYADDPLQSVNLFPTLSSWKEDFLFDVLGKIYRGLQEGGRIAVNICDAPYKKVFVCEDLLAFMKGLGANYEGVIGYPLKVRPRAGSRLKNLLKDGTQAEPVFIWAKGNAPEPLWDRETFFDF